MEIFQYLDVELLQAGVNSDKSLFKKKKKKTEDFRYWKLPQDVLLRSFFV